MTSFHLELHLILADLHETIQSQGYPSYILVTNPVCQSLLNRAVDDLDETSEETPTLDK